MKMTVDLAPAAGRARTAGSRELRILFRSERDQVTRAIGRYDQVY